MLGDGAVEDSEDFSMEDPVCIDGVIFYGPMTDREKMVKERFERRQKEKVKTQFLPTLSNKEFSGNITKASEESKNDINDISIYESFSIDESKYESFNDSLDERKFLNPNEVNVSKFSPEQINVNKRKFQSKPMLKGSLCDSLEDIHSLVSNVEKLSISEEIENINILEKNNIYDDSLRNDVCLENKNFNPTDQNFDDDSLAILDFEKTFDDSLEEADILSLSHMDNVVILRNGENAEISVENLAKENAITKNLFETSVEVIYENAGYVENSEEENAEALKQSSLTADSLSISENMSKDSLDDLPVIPKYLEQKTYKRSLSSLNRDKSDTSRNSSKLKYYGNVTNLSDRDSKPAPEQNLPHNVNESVNEQFTNIKRNASSSNDTIVIEDSFIKSPDATTSIKRENSVKSIEKDFSSCKNDCAKLSSNSASNTNSVVNNHIKISNESINKVDIHPNDTICIDDSFILPQNTSLIEDELHFVDTQIAGSQKVNQENISADNLNDAMYTNNSLQPTLNIKGEKSTPKEKFSKKSINSKFCIQNPIKHKLENLEMEIHRNDTICIDDSFILPQSTSLKKDELYSLETQRSGSTKNSHQNLPSENNGTSNPQLNDTLNNSFTIPPQPMLNIKNEKTPSSLKRKKNKSSQGKDSRSYIQSPVEHQLRHLEKNNEVRVSNVNDTIYINDSPVEPLRVKMEKKSPSSIGSKMRGKSPSQDKNIDSKFHIQSPVKYELQHLEKKNEARVFNLNDTIYIDNSPPESLRIKIDKRSTFSGKSSKTQSPECKNDVSNQKQFISLQTPKVLDSPLEESSKSSISDNIVKSPKKVIDYFKDAFVLPKDLPKDGNLKLQLEVVFDENQGVNIISVSTVDQCTGNITPSVTEVDSRREIVGKANKSPDLSDKNKGAAVIKINDKICETSATSDKIISKSYSPDLSVVTKSYPEKSKTGIIFTDDVQNDSNGHNVQLLEALDLHDASCSFIDNGFLQSRDSIMPLNLCIRRSPETSYRYFTKTESKENIPILDKLPVTPLDHSKNRRRSSTKASNKTPKQLNWNTDVKKSGSKTNSITKIPVRKIDNPFFTPVHQKVSKDIKTGSSSENFFKNPLVKSNSATDNLISAKPLETPRKHHFCSVRNSISRVPKSTPRSIPKRFQNIESPIAKYIGKPQIYTPLKTTHRYDGNLILGNTVKSSKHTIKTPNSAFKGSPQCSSAGKL
ncbi:hypothetical protein AVEN_272577-1 [Araneus ventricosus]|uniref:Uncharacterized protein n=1 Tax=Araneus ventricosus TaxID=182803 RepID=A0A4Y2SFE5_ARAVE|nr:hypothetical protein AVEN_272577-1 [Araneus ventricosus]